MQLLVLLQYVIHRSHSSTLYELEHLHSFLVEKNFYCFAFWQIWHLYDFFFFYIFCVVSIVQLIAFQSQSPSSKCYCLSIFGPAIQSSLRVCRYQDVCNFPVVREKHGSCRHMLPISIQAHKTALKGRK